MFCKTSWINWDTHRRSYSDAITAQKLRSMEKSLGTLPSISPTTQKYENAHSVLEGGLLPTVFTLTL